MSLQPFIEVGHFFEWFFPLPVDVATGAAALLVAGVVAATTGYAGVVILRAR